MPDEPKPEGAPAGPEKPPEGEKPAAPKPPAPAAAKPPEGEKPAAPKPPAAPPATKPAAAHAAPKPPAPMAVTPWESELTGHLREHLGDRITEFSTYLGQNFLVAKSDAVVSILEFLKLEEDFDYL